MQVSLFEEPGRGAPWHGPVKAKFVFLMGQLILELFT
jgi:hypothetical protein